MNDNKLTLEYKLYLIKIFDHLISDSENLNNNIDILIETINNLLSNNFMDNEEIINSIKNAQPDLDYGEWYSSGSWDQSFTDEETTSESYMETGLDDGGIAESIGDEWLDG
jgi:uncharacterized membrane-anchored protein YjiN (DUF445 family)